MTTPEYSLGSDDAEIARLQRQAALIAEPTAVLLRRGGIVPGMRVLDLGSGPGDVSFLVAEMVGADGSVVGVERDPAQLATAEQRRSATDARNVTFREGDARTFVDTEPFDAVVCRLLLMHLPDAVDVLRHHVSNLRSGGVFVAVDYDMGGIRSLPEVELYTAVKRWIEAGFQYAGADPFVGMRFPALFRQAGFTDVGTLGLQVFFPPDHSEGPGMVVGVVRALREAIVGSGVVSESELGLDTLEERLCESVRAAQAVWTMPTIVAGWGRRP